MTINRNVKVWVIVNVVIHSMVLVLFVLGLRYAEYWAEIISLADMLAAPLIFHIFYQGLYIGGLVAIITLGILIAQIYGINANGKHIPMMWIVGEIFIILVGVLDVLPASAAVIGNLYYTIPGW